MEIEKFEKVFGVYTKKKYNLKSFYDSLPEFRKKIDEFLKHCFYKLYSIILVLYFFDYLMIQKKTYVQDVLDDFKV